MNNQMASSGTNSISDDIVGIQKGLAQMTVENCRAMKSLENRLLEELQTMVEAAAQLILDREEHDRDTAIKALEERLPNVVDIEDRIMGQVKSAICFFGAGTYLLGSESERQLKDTEQLSLLPRFGMEKSFGKHGGEEQLQQIPVLQTQVGAVERQMGELRACLAEESKQRLDAQSELHNMHSNYTAQEASERSLGHRSLRDLCTHLAESFSTKFAELQGQISAIGAKVETSSFEAQLDAQNQRSHGIERHLAREVSAVRRMIANLDIRFNENALRDSRDGAPEMHDEFMKHQTQILEEHRDKLAISFEALEMKVRADYDTLRHIVSKHQLYQDQSVVALRELESRMSQSVSETMQAQAVLTGAMQNLDSTVVQRISDEVARLDIKTSEKLRPQEDQHAALIGQLLQEKAAARQQSLDVFVAI